MDMERNTETSGGAQTVNLLENAIALSVELRALGTRRKLKAGDVTVRGRGGAQETTDDDVVHVSKDILESPAYEAIKSLHGDIRGYIERKSVRAKSLYRSGTVLIKADAESVTSINAALEIYERRLQELVNAFCDGDYQAAIARAERKLSPLGLFDAADYPNVEKVRKSFGMKVTMQEIGGVSGKLAAIDAELFRRKVAEMNADIAAATVEVRDVLRAQALELADHLIERLTPDAAGKAKTFKDSTVGNVKEFLDTFDARNLTNDAELSAAVGKMRALLGGVNPQTLRDSPWTRDKVREQFAGVKAALNEMLQDRPTRKFSVD